MPNLVLLPSDLDQRCKCYRAYLEGGTPDRVVDATWRAQLEQERERIGLSPQDARAVEEAYLRANVVTLLTRMGTRLNQAEEHAQTLMTWRTSMEKGAQETQMRVDRAERKLTQLEEPASDGVIRELQTRFARVEKDARDSQMQVARLEGRVDDSQTRLTRVEERASDSQARLTAAERERQQLQERLAQAEKQVQQLQTQLAEPNRQVEQLTARRNQEMGGYKAYRDKDERWFPMAPAN